MTNGQAVIKFVMGLVAIIVMVSFVALIAISVSFAFYSAMTQPQTQQQPAREQAASIALMWRTPISDGASPRQVLQSTAKRMEYEQTTELGSDRNAQALIKVMEAIAILEDRETTTENGFPIIE
jgi:Flp pilus assembly protein TadB